MSKKPLKTTTATDQLEPLLRSYALRRLQESTPSKPPKPVKPQSKRIKEAIGVRALASSPPSKIRDQLRARNA